MATRPVLQLGASAACLLLLAAVQHLHQDASPTELDGYAANRLAGFQASYTPPASGSSGAQGGSASGPNIGWTYSSSQGSASNSPGGQRLEGYQPPKQQWSARAQHAAHKLHQLKSVDAGLFSVRAGPNRAEQVHVYIKQPVRAQATKSQSVKFSQNSLDLFSNLAQEASQGLPTSDAPLPQNADVPSRTAEADDTLEQGLEKKLGAVQYEQARFHFSPEIGYQG